MALDKEKEYDHLIDGGDEGLNEAPMKKKTSHLLVVAIMVPFIAFGGYFAAKSFGLIGQEDEPVQQQAKIFPIVKKIPVVIDNTEKPAANAATDLSSDPAPAAPSGALPANGLTPPVTAPIVAGDLSKDPAATGAVVSDPVLGAVKSDDLAVKEKSPSGAKAATAALMPANASAVTLQAAESKKPAPAVATPVVNEDADNPIAHKSDISIVNTRLDKLEALINQLADAIKGMPSTSLSGSDQLPPVKVHKKSRVKKYRAVAHKAANLTKTEVSSSETKINETKTIDSKLVVESKPKAYIGDSAYRTRVVIPGRAWLVAKDGSFSTVTVGDNLPSAGKVKAINVDTGEITIENGPSIKMGSAE